MSKTNTVRNLTTTALLVALSIILSRMLSIYLIPSLKLSLAGVPLIMIGLYFGPFYGFIGGAISDIIGFAINPAGGGFIPGLTLSTAAVGFVPGLIYYYFKKTKTQRNYSKLNAGIILLLILGISFVFTYTNVLTYEVGQLYFRGEEANLLGILFIGVIMIYTIIPLALNKWVNKTQGLFSLDKIVFTVSITYIIAHIGMNAYFISQAFGSPYEVALALRVIMNFFNIPLHALMVYFLTIALKKARLID
jgi:ECF transporter S component (folate family)